MNGSRKDGHLLGIHVLLSPQSPPSCPVNTQLEQLSPGDVLTHLCALACRALRTFGCPQEWQLWLSQRTYLQPIGAHPAWLPWSALQSKNTKTHQQEHKLLVKLFCSSPSALAFLCLKFPFQFPATFERPKAWDHAPRNTPTNWECGQRP